MHGSRQLSWLARWGALLLAAVLLTGCQTTVGNYFGNRARDFGEMFRLQVGGGFGVGASVSAAGLLDLPMAAANVSHKAGLGWVYGDGYFFGLGETGGFWEGEMLEIRGLPWYWVPPNRSPYYLHRRIDRSPRHSLSYLYAQHVCVWFLPAFIGRVGPAEPPELEYRGSTFWRLSYADRVFWAQTHPWIWSAEARRINPKAHVHAFDVEASVYAGVVYVKVGFSPGELLDFVLGWFGIDIAGDDRPLEPDMQQEEEIPAEELPREGRG